MLLLGYTYKIYNSSYNTEMGNKQCNAGDPETPGGLYRGPLSMLIYGNTIKGCACETLIKSDAMFYYYKCQAVTVVHIVMIVYMLVVLICSRIK